MTIWRLARVKGQLTYYRSFGFLRVNIGEVKAELRRNLIVCPGSKLPEVVFGPGLWSTFGEAAAELGVSYDQIRRHRKEFTRTKFFGKVLLYKKDLESGLKTRRFASRARREKENTEQGL